MVEALKGVAQREDYHPEGDAFNHTLQVFHHAMRESTNLDTILAGLTHDVGKLTSPIGHEEVAVTMLTEKVNHSRLKPRACPCPSPFGHKAGCMAG